MAEERRKDSARRPVSFSGQAVNLLDLEDGWGGEGEEPAFPTPLPSPAADAEKVAAADAGAQIEDDLVGAGLGGAESLSPAPARPVAGRVSQAGTVLDPATEAEVAEAAAQVLLDLPPENEAEPALGIEFVIEEPEAGAEPGTDVDLAPPGTEDPSALETPPAGVEVISAYAAAFDDIDSGADAMDLVEARHAHPTEGDVGDLMRRAVDLASLGDFSGSLALVERVLAVEPGHREAREYLAKNRATLLAMYESKIGPLSQVPVVAIPQGEIVWLNLDHRAGFVLSQIDGEMSFEDVLDLCSMPRLEVCKIFVELLAESVIQVKAPSFR